MYLNALFTIFITLASILALLFIIIFIRSGAWRRIKANWREAVRRGSEKYAFVRKVAELERLGKKEFHFDNGNVTVWAKNQEQANFKYEQLVVRRGTIARMKRIQKANEKKNAARLASRRRNRTASNRIR